MLLKSLFLLGSPRGDRARLSVLMFHRVVAAPDPMFPDEMYAARFESLCAWLKDWFRVLPLDEAAAALQTGRLPARSLSITFDDGYADNYEVALPILQRHGIPATFFVTTGFLDGGRMWNDSLIESVRHCSANMLDLRGLGLGAHPLGDDLLRRKAAQALIQQVKYLPPAQRLKTVERVAALAQVRLPTDLMMRSEQVLWLRRAGMQIGAHTVTHPILKGLADEEARAEIAEGRDVLQRILGERVRLFAYPNGRPDQDYSKATVDTVRTLGFDAAVTTEWGITMKGDDPMQIRRFTPWDTDRSRFGLRMLANLRRRGLGATA